MIKCQGTVRKNRESGVGQVFLKQKILFCLKSKNCKTKKMHIQKIEKYLNLMISRINGKFIFFVI